MAAYERHVFVCNNTRQPGHPRGCCGGDDAAQIIGRLKELVKARGLRATVRVNSAGCLDQCEHGITIVVYPEAVWYGFVTPADLEEIFESHIVGGTPVERLRMPSECIATEKCQHRGGGFVSLGGP